MPERIPVADGEELDYREKAMWLLIRKLGGTVTVTDQEWSSAPDWPELILDRSGGVMVWTAREPASPVAAESPESEIPGTVPLPGMEPGPHRSESTGQSAEEAADIIRDTGA